MGKITSKSLIAFIYSTCVFCILGSSVNAQDIVVTEINYHSDSTRDAGAWVEIFNRSSAAVDITNWVFSDDDNVHFFIIPSKTLNPGEYAVITQDQTLFTVMYPSVSNTIPGSFVFGLGNKGDQIRLFNESGTLHFSMEYADSLGWPKCADGHGRTLEIKNVSGNFNDPTNWFDGCMMGSPGASWSPCMDPVIFSELNYNPISTNDAGDWVELRNITNANIDISNWVLRDKSDSNGFVLPANTILPPGGNFVIAEDLSKFNTYFPSVGAMGSFLFGFKNSKDIIRLYNSSGVIEYSLQYKDEYPWPIGADGYGYTLELKDSSKTVNDGTNWKSGCKGGSPGRYYNTACLVGINDINSESIAISIYPNPMTESSYLRIESGNEVLKGEPNIAFYDLLGSKIDLSYKLIKKESYELTYEISTKNIAPGVYFYEASIQGKQKITGKAIVSQ